MGRVNRDILNMQIAMLVSDRSTCLRNKVGCVIAKEGRIIVTGYNGVASGVEHCSQCLGPNCGISIHAEEGTITYAARKGISLEGSSLYVTTSPCMNCARMILNAGIKSVYFKDLYRDESGIAYLKKNGVRVFHIMGRSGKDE